MTKFEAQGISRATSPWERGLSASKRRRRKSQTWELPGREASRSLSWSPNKVRVTARSGGYVLLGRLLMTVIETTDHAERALHEPADGFDARLGDGTTRYLGEGHRRVLLDVSTPVHEQDDSFHSLASLSYPADWSVKAGQDREPHLSTIDAIRIATTVTNAIIVRHLPHLAGYPLEQALSVRAGARPWTELAAVPVRSHVRVGSDGESLFTQHQVGSLRVESTWGSGTAAAIAAGGDSGRATSLRLRDDDSATCDYAREQPCDTPMAFLEALTLTAQLSQVVLYGGTPGARASSGNMWMRRAQFRRLRSDTTHQQSVALSLRHRRVMTVGDTRIETTDVVAEDVFGIHVTAALATA